MLPPLFMSQYLRIGGYCLAAGAAVFGMLALNAMYQGEKVKLEVVSAGERATSEGFRYSPRFRVVDGKYAGKRFGLGFEVSPKPHERGDIVEGRYDPLTGWILSNSLLVQSSIMSLVVFILGLAAAFVIAPVADGAVEPPRNGLLHKQPWWRGRM